LRSGIFEKILCSAISGVYKERSVNPASSPWQGQGLGRRRSGNPAGEQKCV
jgi:hypothetical protein